MNTPQSHIQTLVSAFGKDAPIAYRLLNTHAKAMEVKKHPKNGTGTPQQCDANAYALAQPETAYRYCEGQATTSNLDFPLDHAWVIDRDGKVIDPTWADGAQYFGVAFSPLFVIKVLAKTKHYGILGNLYRLRMTPDSVMAYLENGLQSIAPTTGVRA